MGLMLQIFVVSLSIYIYTSGLKEVVIFLFITPSFKQLDIMFNIIKITDASLIAGS